MHIRIPKVTVMNTNHAKKEPKVMAAVEQLA